jgi:hypothetical protein
LEVGEKGTVVAAAAWIAGRAGSLVVAVWALARPRAVRRAAAMDERIVSTVV